MSTPNIQDRSLLILILDLTPKTWGKRAQIRNLSDKQRASQNKGSMGPATLNEVLNALLSFLIAFSSCHRDNTVIVIGVAGKETAVLHPRKDRLEDVMGVSSLDKSMDLVEMRDGIMLGVTELINQCVENSSKEGYIDRGTAIAAATSLGLCLINRVMKSATAGSSLLEENSLFRRKEDEGILGMISAKLNKEGENATKFAAEQRLAQRRARGMLSPRMLIVQASEDCTLDYNAFMNCVFAAIKNDVVIDGCFLSSPNMPETSTFLEQATDRSGGVYSKPKGTAQIFGGLTEVLMTVFLPPLGIRNDLNLPKVTEVDFRARCFETGESLDMGFVCNLCLSIFKNEPSGDYCLTCGAKNTSKNGQDSGLRIEGLKDSDEKKESEDSSQARKKARTTA